MQPLAWYVKRLRTMSSREIAWRARSAFRDAADRYRLARGRYPLGLLTEPPSSDEAVAPHSLVAVAPGAWQAAPDGSPEARWREALVRRADPLVEHRFTFFNLADRHLGDPIDWNRDHGNGRAAPLAFSPSIDYRDWRVTGDCKFVWEPNRHHQLVVLGRAYRATGNRRYADAAVEQLTSWLDQSPFGRGMNWRSPLEVAIRAINWVWMHDLLKPSGAIGGAVRRRMLGALELHVREIVRKYSRGSSANNHLIGEAAGVFVAATCFPWMRNATEWAADSRRILVEQIQAQTYEDGCTREQAFGYHLFVAQFLLAAGAVARRAGVDFPDAYWRRLERMIAFAAAMSEGGPIPMIGDADDGYVLDLDGSPRSPGGIVACGAALLGRRDLEGRGPSEAAAWLVDAHPVRQAATSPPALLEPRAFPQAGYYLLQTGAGPDAIRILFDCGELGFGAIAAHGHADALSFTLDAAGVEVLVDPGTYDYFTYPAHRAYFRSTRAHNALVVDGEDQSVPDGPFLWGRRASARCVVWEPGQLRAAGEHDGYTRLDDPVVHRRRIEVDPGERVVTVVDELMMRGAHEIALYFHFAERWHARPEETPGLIFSDGSMRLRVELDERLAPATLRGSERPLAGWVSRGYHVKAPACTVRAAGTLRGDTRLTTRIRLAPE